MRILWLSFNGGAYEPQTAGSWIAALQQVVETHCPDISLALAFEHPTDDGVRRNGRTAYYPICLRGGVWNRLRTKLDPSYTWQRLAPRLRQVIDDFRPDVIHSFGSENAYALAATLTDVPVVIHMQGFNNLYNLAERQALRVSDYYSFYHYNPLQILHFRYRYAKLAATDRMERTAMAATRYFMGRTQWDRAIVGQYGPAGATYFDCPEAIRRPFLTAAPWQPHPGGKLRLITIGSASALKGNGLILQTARIMRDELHLDFEWRVTGNASTFRLFEHITGIRAADVHVRFLGFLDAESIVDELRQAEMYVHTAIIDNSPNALCEAQTVGTPVVTTYVGGIPQLVQDGRTGIFYPYNEPHTLAWTLARLHESPDTLAALSAAERAVAHARHDEAAIGRRLTDIYHTIASAPQP